MNIYLLQLVGKWTSMLLVSVISLLSSNPLNEQTINKENDVQQKGISVVSEVIKYDTIKTYNYKIPSNITKVLIPGIEGLSIFDDEGNKKVIKEVTNEKIEIGTGESGEFEGVMTAYGPDCSTCSGRGFVACKTREKTNFNLITDGIYYNDTEFGKVRVLAAAHEKFPCGTIVKVDGKGEEFVGIVLDTGWGMRNSLENNRIHFDVAFTTEKDKAVKGMTDMSGNVKYNVQRWGW